MKSFTVAATFFAMFAAAAVALPYNSGQDNNDLHRRNGDSISIGGCNNEGDDSGLANNLLKGGALADSKKHCRQTVVQHNGD